MASTAPALRLHVLPVPEELRLPNAVNSHPKRRPMGMIRKLSSLSSAGLISYHTPEEKAANAAARSSRADKRLSKAQAKLLKEQRKALKRQNNA